VFHAGRFHETRVLERAALGPGRGLRGPAVVTDDGATLWVAPGWTARADRGGSLMLAPERSR
jgi:N-methylhydantoinase A/oxoprolinase/acetone carboxylase beta subunit